MMGPVSLCRVVCRHHRLLTSRLNMSKTCIHQQLCGGAGHLKFPSMSCGYHSLMNGQKNSVNFVKFMQFQHQSVPCSSATVGNQNQDQTQQSQEHGQGQSVSDGIASIVENLNCQGDSSSGTQEHIHNIVQYLVEMKLTADEIIKHLTNNNKVLLQPLSLWKLTLESLKELGFQSNQLLPAVTSFLVTIDGKLDQLTLTLDTLRALGFRDGQIQKMVLTYPSLVDFPSKKLIKQYNGLLQLFPRSGYTQMLVQTPSILVMSLDDIQMVYDYVLKEMGVDMKYMVKTNFLRYDFNHIYSRHQFLERSGLYHKPDKYGSTPTPNPTFREIVDTTDHVFAVKVAGMSVAEYKAFTHMCDVQREHGMREYSYLRDEEDIEDETI